MAEDKVYEIKISEEVEALVNSLDHPEWQHFCEKGKKVGIRVFSKMFYKPHQSEEFFTSQKALWSLYRNLLKARSEGIEIEDKSIYMIHAFLKKPLCQYEIDQITFCVFDWESTELVICDDDEYYDSVNIHDYLYSKFFELKESWFKTEDGEHLTANETELLNLAKDFGFKIRDEMGVLIVYIPKNADKYEPYMNDFNSDILTPTP